MHIITEVTRAIKNILIPYSDSVDWKSFGSKGNPCFDPYDLTPTETIESALTLAAVTLAMPKGGNLHKTLAKDVAAVTGNAYVTYPWLQHAVSRILTFTTYKDLLCMCVNLHTVRKRMKEKGLTKIASIEEALR